MMHQPESEYKNRIEELAAQKEGFLKVRKQFSFYRLGLFILTIIISYQLLTFSIGAAIAGLVLFAALFVWVVKKDIANDAAIRKIEELILIYQNELRTGKTENLFGDGHEHHDSKHPYTFDLDIFGRFSLFSFMNRTVTEKGSNLLATWLKGPSEEPVILLRQQAAQELSKKQSFKEAFLRTFFLGEKNETRLINWVSSFKVVLHEKRLLKSLIFILPATSL
ncbi:MAG: hypothetical protein R6U64_01190, partial [Bacteroidales bacterium]